MAFTIKMIPLLSLITLLLPLVASSHLPPPHKRSSHERARKNFDLIHANATEEVDPSLSKRGQTFSGTGTYYYTGLGACGQNSVDSDLMVALNSAQYGGGYPGPQCFKSITVQANGKTVGGVTILDECPTCGYGSLDLSPGLFSHFADFSAGVVSITWWFSDDASAPETSTTPTSTWTPPTSTWVAPSTTPTSTWHEPSTTSTSQWVAPSTSSTPEPSTSTYTPPPPQSSSTTVASSSASSSSSTITSTANSATISALSASATSTIARNSTNPYVVVNKNSTATAVTGSNSTATTVDGESTTENDGSTTAQVNVNGNLQAFNALAAQYGQLVVVAAEAAA